MHHIGYCWDVSPEHEAARFPAIAEMATFVANLRAIRLAREMTQAQLAEKMGLRGFSWHPATVYKVENGDRQIQLGEALAMARIFEIPIEEMIRVGGHAYALSNIRSRCRHLKRQRDHLIAMIDIYFTDSEELAHELDNVDVQSLFSPDELKEMMREADPKSDVVASLRAAYQAMQRLDGQRDDSEA